MFSANGSHGVWGDAGKFEYSRQPSLIDFTSRGVGWRLWFNLVYIDARDAGTFSGTDLQWADFRGRWGNDDRLVSIASCGGGSLHSLHKEMSKRRFIGCVS